MNKRKMLTRIIASVVAVMMLVSLMACGKSKAASKTPEEAVKGFLDNLVKGDFTAVQKYTTSNTTYKFNNDQEEKSAQAMYKGLKYEITNTKTDGDNSTVTVKVTLPDLMQLMAKLMSGAGNIDPTDKAAISKAIDDGLAKIDEVLKDPSIKMSTNEVSLKVVKKSGKWLLEGNADALLSSLSGLGDAGAGAAEESTAAAE